MRASVVLVGVFASSQLFAQQSPVATWQSPTSGSVSAQPSTAALVSNLQLTAPWLFGEPSGSAGPSSWVLSTPLRLSLQGDIHPLAGGFPNCVSREEPSGNTVNGFAVQRFASIGLTKALTLQGFSSAGCPVDGAIGGSLTYTAALQPSLWFVAGAGVYGVPGHAPYPPRLSNDLRVDLMKQLNDQHAVTVGVGRRGITIGGTW